MIKSGSNSYKKSLNISFRKKEVFKIVNENHAFLKRLQTKKSYYDVSKWKKEYKHTKKMLRNMCEFPYKLGSISKSPRRLERIANGKAIDLVTQQNFNKCRKGSKCM